MLVVACLLPIWASAQSSREDLDRAAEFYRQGRFDDALEIYRGYLRSNPEGAEAAEASFGVADCLLGAGRYSPAVDAYNAALEKYGDSARAAGGLVGLGKAKLQLGLVREAAENFEAALKKSSDAGVRRELDALLADTYYELGNFSEAVAPLERLAAGELEGSELGKAQLRLADCFYRLGEYVKARNLFSRLLDADPELLIGSPELTFRWGELLLFNGEYDPAGIVLQGILTDYPTQPVYQHALLRMGDLERLRAAMEGDLQRRTAQLGRAIGHYRRLLLESELQLRAADEDSRMLSDIASLRIVQCADLAGLDLRSDLNLEPADTLLEGVIKRSRMPEMSALAYLLLARSHVAAGRGREALENYRILDERFGHLDLARSTISEYSVVARELMERAYREGDYAGYVDIFMTDGGALSLSQEDQLKLAESYSRVQIYDRAAQLYSRLTKEAESEATRRRAAIGLARAQAALGDNDKALSGLKEFLASNPPAADREEARLIVLDIHYRLGDIATLRRLWTERQGELNTPRLRAKAMFSLAMLAKRAGDADEALELLERFLLEFGNGLRGGGSVYRFLREAYLALGDLYYDSGQIRVAAGYYELFIALFGDSEDIAFPLFQAANCRLRLGEVELAAEIFRELIRLYPKSGWSSQAQLSLEEIDTAEPDGSAGGGP